MTTSRVMALLTGADGDQFSIVPETGVLTFTTAPNYEAPADVAITDPVNAANNNEYIVVVEAKSGTGARELTHNQTLTVTVSDVDTEAPGVPATPTIAQATFNSLKMAWSVSDNTGPAISAYDVRHILSSATDKVDDTKWTEVTDAWTSNNGGILEYTISGLSQGTSYDIQVRAENDEGTSGWSSSVAGITEANVAPVIASISPITVAENSTADIVTVSATDADSDDDIESFGIVDGADGDQFSIVPETGVLTFTTAPNYEAPADVLVADPSSGAGDNEYIVVVEAKSGTGDRALTGSQTLTVTVSDVDTEAPGVPDAPTVAQATFNSLKVAWTAPDNTGPAITAYDVRHILTSASTSDKTDDTKWTVAEDAWTSNNGGNLEYTISGLSQGTSYDIQVRAENDEGTSGWSSSVAGVTEANVAPVIASISPITVAENSTAALVTVSATDADSDDDIESFGIVDGADGDQFSIVPETGVLTFTTAPNYEVPADVMVTNPASGAGDNEYVVIVTATSGTGGRALTATQTLTVTVSDVNEAPGVPAAPTVAEATLNSLKVQWSAPDNMGPDISAYDVRHILTSASASDKMDDTKWTVAEDAWTSDDGGNLEYTISSLSQGTSYDVQVRAENDEGTSGWSSSVAGMTVANVAPVIASISPITVAENSTAALVTVSATDADSDDNITGYSIVNAADGSQFEITSGGVLSFKTAPNYEDPKDVAITDPVNAANNNEYIVVVEAKSGTGDRELTATQTVKVTVSDVNTEAPGVPAVPTVASTTFNSLTIGWEAPDNTGPAIIAYDVRHILTSASTLDKMDDTKWTVAEDAWTSDDGGNLEYTISSLSQGTSYDVQVRAENDEGTSGWSSSVAGMTVANVAPVIASISPITVAENSTAALVTVSATDADSDDNITGYSIVDAADGSQFEITSGGVLSFKTAPNYEDPKDVAITDPVNAANNNEYIVVVEAKSGTGDRELTATQTVKVTVSDVDTEAPGVPAVPTVASTTFNSLTIGWEAPDNTGPAIIAYDVRHILTSASTLDKMDDTKWTEVADAWTSNNGGNLEYTISGLSQATSYDIQVRAESDEGTSGWSSSVAGVTEANVAPVIASISPITVAENSTAAIVTVTATDSDNDDDIESFGIVDGADGDQFSIVPETGVLTFTTAPNYEAPADVLVTDPVNAANNNEYIVVVEAKSGTGARELTATQTVKVTVSDVDTEAPSVPAVPTVASTTFNSLTIGWEAPTNTGPAISAYDVRYILTSEDETDDTKWTVAEDAWTSNNGGNLEYTISGLSQGTSYDIQVRAENDEGTSGWSSSVAGMTVANVAPVIASISPITVAENSTAALVTVSATDSDSDDNITGYGIVTGADGDQFSIVPETGVLTFKVAPNYEAPADVLVTNPASGAGDNEYIVVVEAKSGTDARELTHNQTLTVTVSDVDTEAPGVPATPTIAQATFNSLKVAWSVPDNTGPAISAYDVRHILSSATDKADDTKWTVAEDAWTSNNGGNLEYTISGLSQGTSYDVQVRAGNDEGTSGWSSSVAGMTVANVAPVIASISPITVAENSTAALVTVSATDADSDDDIESFGIVTGADGDQFSIVPETGVLTFKVAPNYEAPADVLVTNPASGAGDNEYIVVVEAKSGTGARELTHNQTLTVTVSDVDTEAPGVPATPTIAQATFNSLKVAWSVPDNTGPAISAYDVRHILSSATDKADDTKWTVAEDAWTSNNGGNLEYTISGLSQRTSYDVQVRAENDEGTSGWSSSVAGMTVANVAPVIASISPITVAENSTADIVTVSATDADSDDDIESFGIVDGADGDQFSIVPETGVLTFTTAPNYEAPADVLVADPSSAAGDNEYIVVVEAKSGTGARELTATQTVKVTVSDVDTEAPSVPAAPTVASTTFNSLTIGWEIPTNTGPAISAYDVRHILSSAPDKADANWTVAEDAWTSGNGGNLEYTISGLSQGTSYDIQVRASNDEGTSGWSSSVVEMTRANVAPVFTSASAASVSENSTADIVTVTATDADSDDNITGYGIVTGADRSQFSIVPATGVLTFKVAPNYEVPLDVVFEDAINPSNNNAANNNEYIVVVEATSGTGARELAARDTLTVTVSDVNEAPGVPGVPTVASTTFNSLTIGWEIPTNTGPAISAYDVRHILSSAPDKADANWTVAEDAWTSGNGGNLEYTISGLSQGTSYDIQVRASNDEGTSGWSSSVVEMTRANVAPVFTSASAASVSENSTADIVTVTATDADSDDNITGYGIVTGADRSQFSIVPATGVLTFKVAPNYEVPLDVVFEDAINPSNNNAANNNEYIVVVEATSGTGARELTATQTVKVTVSDVNTEAPAVPAAPTVASTTFNSLTIGWEAPTNTGPAISAYDVRHILSSVPDKADANWTVAEDAWTSGNGGNLEYTISSLSQSMSYDVQVRASNDEGTSGWSSSVVEMTRANVAPIFTSASAASVSENSTADIVTVTATDADSEDNITGYGLVTGADRSQFSIVPATGVLTFKVAPNYEVPLDVVFEDVVNPWNDNAAHNNEYIVVVRVMSGTGNRVLTASQTLTVTVTDLDDAPERPDAPTVTQTTPSSLTVAWGEISILPSLSSPVGIALDISAGNMYWTESGRIRRANLDGTQVQDQIPTAEALNFPTGIALDISGGKMYWTDSGTDKIQRANINGTNVQDLITTGLDFPVGIALDISASKMYWADRVTDKIQRADLDGTGVEDLINTGLNDPTSIALDISNSKMYWTEGDVGKIRRANLDGTGIEDLVTTGLSSPWPIALDISAGKMYWADRDTDKIQRADLDGTGVEDLVTTTGGPLGLALDIAMGKIYWTDVERGKILYFDSDFKYDVQYKELPNGSFTTWIQQITALPTTITGLSPDTGYDIQVRATSVDGLGPWSTSSSGRTDSNVSPTFTSSATFEMHENNIQVGTVIATDADSEDSITDYMITGGSDQALFEIVQSTGMLSFITAPDYDAASDADNNNEYILEVTASSGAGDRVLSQAQTITVTVTNVTNVPGTPNAPTLTEPTLNSLTVNWNTPTFELNNSAGSRPIDVALDITGNKIYWVDYFTHDLQYANLDGTDIQILITMSNLSIPSSIALDTVGGKIYWAVQGTSRGRGIRRADIDGQNIDENFIPATSAQGIALDIARNKIYWKNFNRIQRANLDDGTSVEDLITGLDDPENIALDIVGSKIYWTENGTDKIRYANLDGTNIQDLITTGLDDIWGIALDIARNKIYWTNSSKIQRANLDGTNVEDLITSLSNPRGIALDIARNEIYWADDVFGKIQWANIDLSYEVQYQVVNSGSFRVVKSDAFVDAQYNGTDVTMTLTGLASDTNYEVQVRAKGEEGTGAWSASGTGMTLGDGPVVFTSSTTFDVLEKQTWVGKISANNASSYAITGGADQTQFSINASTGVLTFNAPPDYEMPSDVNTDNEYIFQVTARNDAVNPVQTATRTITVTVEDWTDVLELSMLTSPLSTLDQMTVQWQVSGSDYPSGSPTGLVLDRVGNKIYWIDGSSNIRRMNLDGTNVENLVDISAYGTAEDIVLDIDGNKMYWIDDVKIRYADLDGSNVQDLTTSGSGAKGIALDIDGGKVYWALFGNNIWRANLDGTERESVFTPGLVYPNGSIALDIAGGKMYWTSGTSERIRRANLDGTNVENLVHSSAGGTAQDIALDFAGGKMYWTDSSTGNIKRADFDGSNIEVLITTEGLNAPEDLALDIARNKVYWIEGNKDKIQKADIDVSYAVDYQLKNPNGSYDSWVSWANGTGLITQNLRNLTTTITGLMESSEYRVRVTATSEEGRRQTLLTVTINTTHSFDLNGPVIYSLDEGSTGNIGDPISVTNPDNDALVYSLRGSDAGSFGINSNTGQLRTKAGVTYDYDTKRVHPVTIQADDGRGGTDEIQVNIAVLPSDISTTYRDFVESKEDGSTPILPDFSYAGYHNFEKPVPDVNTLGYMTFDVTDYGAVANDHLSDESAIKDAIEAAETQGSGIVFFPSGEFLVSTDADKSDDGEGNIINHPIYITGSNIVLKGRGSRHGGTIIRQVNNLPAENPDNFWTVPPMFTIKPADWSTTSNGTVLTTLTEDALRETFWITVADASMLSVGQWIRLYLTSADAADDFIHPENIRSDWTIMKDEGMRVREKYTIAEIDGNRVRLNEPLHAVVIKAAHGWEVRTFDPLEEVGVEDICFQGTWRERYEHHKNARHNSGWTLLELKGCVNSWIRRVSFVSVNMGMKIRSCAAFSIYQVTLSGNQGHYFIKNQQNYGLWFGLAEDYGGSIPGSSDREGQDHGANCMSYTTGTVYWKHNMYGFQAIDLHGDRPYANLYDNISGGVLTDAVGGGDKYYPHHLRHLVTWNHKNRSTTHRNYNYWQSELRVVRPIIVGYHGGNIGSVNSTGVLESKGTEVVPGSLFLAQLELRLGEIPSWISTLETEWTTLKANSVSNPSIFIKKKISDKTVSGGDDFRFDKDDHFVSMYNFDSSDTAFHIEISDDTIVQLDNATGDHVDFETPSVKPDGVTGSTGETDVTVKWVNNETDEEIEQTFKVTVTW